MGVAPCLRMVQILMPGILPSYGGSGAANWTFHLREGQVTRYGLFTPRRREKGAKGMQWGAMWREKACRRKGGVGEPAANDGVGLLALSEERSSP